MTDKILYRVLCDEYEEVARIFFEIKETGEQIEGSHQIQKWINNLFNENEQLKQSITEVVELLSEEVDLFSDKATEHDINAYIELKELDNKDAFYMATATKKAIRMLKGLKE